MPVIKITDSEAESYIEAIDGSLYNYAEMLDTEICDHFDPRKGLPQISNADKVDIERLLTLQKTICEASNGNYDIEKHFGAKLCRGKMFVILCQRKKRNGSGRQG